jgi:hypothetical protein
LGIGRFAPTDESVEPVLAFDDTLDLPDPAPVATHSWLDGACSVGALFVAQRADGAAHGRCCPGAFELRLDQVEPPPLSPRR